MRARLSQRRGEKVTALLRRVTPRGAVTALSVMQLLDMISAGHVVIPLGLLHSEETPGGLFACVSTPCVRGDAWCTFLLPWFWRCMEE
ncbi:hypothetical protein CesoFtcFv8_017435 [Champsocephalus esox]|uniref:Uncharacterized protein n=1 Tax=Champsocephalus esox TaxID=159716 RepID=A0AAN8GP41_9TELE|nr:hypothetical protein CesoFtcFv8_017435 [Champsocephalus esox]